MKSNIPEAEWPGIIKAFKCSSLSDVSREYGYSRYQIKKILLMHGIEFQKGPIHVRAVDPTPEEIEQMKAEIDRRRRLEKALNKIENEK
jgi:hypothetical protein